MPAARGYEVIVVGLGAMGAATCRALAARGGSVLGLDRYRPPHCFGSTHGETRITRLAIGEGAEYVPLVRRSHELWREIEADTGASLLTQTGGLVLAERHDPFLARTRAAARTFGIAHENLSPDQLVERFPMFAVEESTEGYFEPESGYVRPEAAVQAQLELARRDGAELRFGERVISFTAARRGVSVHTEAASYSADRLVLCAGPWLPELFAEARESFVVYRQHLHWFAIRRGFERLRELPVFIWVLGADPGAVHPRSFYGLPPQQSPEMKLATESYDEPARPDGRAHHPSSARTAAVYREYVQPRLPWLAPEAPRTVSCLYTSTPSGRFVIDRHPSHDAVLIVSACSGHGFKHSPAIGEAVAEWATTGTTPRDLAPFQLAGARAPGG